MPNIEKLKQILNQQQQELSRLDPDAQQFLNNRIIGGNSIFEWPTKILHVAFCLSTRRNRTSLPHEQDLDFEAAQLIVDIQKHNLANKNTRRPNGA
jgi:hypothetical protein